MAKSRIQIAKSDIVEFFEKLPSKIHTQKDLSKALAEHRAFWRLADSMSARDFTDWLTEHSKLRVAIFPFPKPYRTETRYVWGDAPFYEIVLSAKQGAYFSHYTAVYLHGLTEQLPKTIYLNQEQKLGSNSTGELTQKGIDAAFKRAVRSSNNVAATDDMRVCVIAGKNTGQLGVEDQLRTDLVESRGTPAKIRLTNLERTLIDIVVRPIYSGGPTEVLQAYRLAKDRVSVNRLSAMLSKLAYIYPYHQVIGFYMERAGYASPQLDLLRKQPLEFNFYLTHQMKDSDFNDAWRLFVPKGF